ncbi:sensor of ECF-type sigma factor [Aquimarina algicola]|uniref:Sensor of ECF-type sigma factor n=1 Tax=Aquimarina algicola TaxID=2589995 RepID=A0A504J933_9FLAO|nr:sensor of ECF-type sigma factor [Aquimarina algicola]TPN85095.1 sensor of ECF-type sigma factor [Aquimarina algicola]
MKKILLLICFLLYINVNAQSSSKERIRAFRVAHITESLDLSSKKAQEFWPVYNEYEEKVSKLKSRERKLIRALRKPKDNSDELTEKDAEGYLRKYLEAEEQRVEARKKLITDLRKIMSNKKILKLIKAEADFNKKILDKIREQRRRD